MKPPDVIATVSPDTTLLEAQTDAAAHWLASRCGAQLENRHDQIRIDSEEEHQIIKELQAAGFVVLEQG